jgi:hypothetical protein
MPAIRWPLTYVILMGLVALASSLWRSYGASETCEMDGQELTPALRVDLTMADGTSHAFCTIVCAQRWLANQPNTTPKLATVRDAITGEPVDAYTAFFVQSKLVTNRANANNIHAFRDRKEAMEHIEHFGGHEIPDPFGVD